MYSIRQRGKLLRTLTNADLAVLRYDVALQAVLDVTDTRLLRLRKIARLSIVDVFTRSDNYAIGVDSTVQALTNYVLRHLKRRRNFANMNDVWECLRDGTKAQRQHTLAEIDQILIAEALTVLVGTNDKPGVLQYMRGSREWVAPQSLIDEDEQLRREVGWLPTPRAPRLFNDRSWHGRPRRDRKNGTTEGISAGRGQFGQR